MLSLLRLASRRYVQTQSSENLKVIVFYVERRKKLHIIQLTCFDEKKVFPYFIQA